MRALLFALIDECERWIIRRNDAIRSNYDLKKEMN